MMRRKVTQAMLAALEKRAEKVAIEHAVKQLTAAEMKEVWLPIFEEQYHALTGQALVEVTIRYVNDWRNVVNGQLLDGNGGDGDDDTTVFTAMRTDITPT